MDIATWNVNSLRARLPRVLSWIESRRPDVLCLQETKCPDELFPTAELEALGYRSAFCGEKALNGVAILARAPLEDVETSLPGREDDAQRRFIEARVGGLTVIDVYVPNGQAVGSDAFYFKLDWLSRLQAHLVERHSPDEPLALLGDFNIAPDDRDVADPPAWQGRLHCTDIERRSLGYLTRWGLEDALRRVHPDGRLFSWFDYRSTYRKFRSEGGLRIDLIYVTPPLAARLVDVRVDLEERAGEQTSDHAPVIASFADE